LVLSITVFFIGSILAIVFGIVARRQIRESRGAQGGDGLALAGVIVGIVQLVLSVAVITLIIVLIANGTFTRLVQGDVAINGAPGYTTTTGEYGRPLAEGRPWGRPCQPIVFQVSPSMPTAQYDLIRQAVFGARALGVDVTIETQSLQWYPSLLYPAGQTNATTKVVPIFSSTQASPPRLSNGEPERIQFGWDTSLAPDGRHEHLTDLQATLYLTAVTGNPQDTERATRQLVAFSQGVAESTSPGSSITTGNAQAAFSSRDVAAMERMSGCTFEPTSQSGQNP
jgi:hypothetical protein